MPRNLDRRIETLFPIEDSALKQELIEILDFARADNVNARLLRADGSYERLVPGKNEPHRHSQVELMARARDR
jgi:polyphosphate kinase